MNERYFRLIQRVFAGRIEPFAAALCMALSEEERGAYREVKQVLASYALAAVAPSQEPSVGLRARVLGDFQARLSHPGRTVLLVLDMIADHLTEGRPLEVPRARDIVPALARTIGECRARGVPIVHIVDEHRADDPDLGIWGHHAVIGSGGNTIWPALSPEAGDRIVKKRTYSAFYESELHRTLSHLGCDSLILTGCLTEIGVMATATEALERGYAVEVPAATQAGISAMTEEVTLKILQAMPPSRAARMRLLATQTSS